MPMRESHSKEAPYPKSKKMTKDDKDAFYVDIEERDPVWLKDKGDHFFWKHDYNAALWTYCKAIEADWEFLKVYLNWATTFIKMRKFENCIEDCDDIIKKISDVKEEEKQDDPFYIKVLARAYVKWGAANAFLSKLSQAVDDIEAGLNF